MIIDLHCDTILRLWEDGGSLLSNGFHVDLERLVSSGYLAECFAIFTPEENSRGLTRFETMRSLHDLFVTEMDRCKDIVTVCRDASEIESGRLNVILTIEGMAATEGLDDRIEEVFSWHPAIMSLTWNEVNVYASPQSTDEATMRSGLTRKGFELVERAAEKGIAIDVSHLSDKGFQDLMSIDAKVLATHSNCRAVASSTRNLTDEMLRALAEKGGVAGLNLCIPFLHDFSLDDPARCSRVDDMVLHLRHMIDVGGEDLPALGTDFDGIGGRLEIDGAGDMPILIERLEKEFGTAVTEKITFRNALRFLS